jgi:hypothetical protein
MNALDREKFWELYHSVSRPAIIRACRSASRTLSDGTMDPDEMVSWADSRVWKLLEQSGWPTFHDDPTPEVAAERLRSNAKTVARWAYLALCRKHWRRRAKRVDLAPEQAEGMSRVERLSVVSESPMASVEDQEDIDRRLAELRETVSASLRARIAASWPEPSERGRIAIALGVDDEEGQDLMDKATDGSMKKNTVQQMRSRALRAAQEVTQAARRSAGALLVAGLLGLFTLGAQPAHAAPEQTGGRGGKSGQMLDASSDGSHSAGAMARAKGEQTGGRGGKG